MPPKAAAVTPHREDEDQGLVLEDLAYAEEPQRGNSELGIDYSDTDSPMSASSESRMSASQADDIYQTADKAFQRQPEEKIAPEQETVGLGGTGLQDAEDTVGLGANDDGGLDISMPLPPIPSQRSEDVAETKPVAPPEPSKRGDEETIDISRPAKPATPNLAETQVDNPAEMSFNSLMFGADQTAMPGASMAGPPAEQEKPKAPAAEGNEDLTLTTFNRQYSDVMFGSDMEQTKAPPGMEQMATPSQGDLEKTAMVNPPAAKPAGGEDQTVRIEGDGGGDQNKTVAVGAAGGGQKMSMFDRQKSAGTEAMEAGDYARAVQCLSVAASLKPGDKEVRALLEEARQKRHQ
jgi:hypothetical protein